MIFNTDHQKGLDAARRVAKWELGQSDWADRLIHAYLDPNRAIKELQHEMKEEI